MAYDDSNGATSKAHALRQSYDQALRDIARLTAEVERFRDRETLSLLAYKGQEARIRELEAENQRLRDDYHTKAKRKDDTIRALREGLEVETLRGMLGVMGDGITKGSASRDVLESWASHLRRMVKNADALLAAPSPGAPDLEKGEQHNPRIRELERETENLRRRLDRIHRIADYHARIASSPSLKKIFHDIEQIAAGSPEDLHTVRTIVEEEMTKPLPLEWNGHVLVVPADFSTGANWKEAK